MLSGIQLPGPVIEELYKLPLIPGEKKFKTTSTSSSEEKIAGYKFLGKNQRHIVMITHFEKAVFLPEDHLQFITKILEACKMNLADVAIINTASAPVNIEVLRKQLTPSFIILFGIEPVNIGLPLSFPHFKDQAYAGCNYLFTPAMDELNQDTDKGKLLKSKLWLCLKKMFNV